jgi:hypothetical protein
MESPGLYVLRPNTDRSPAPLSNNLERVASKLQRSAVPNDNRSFLHSFLYLTSSNYRQAPLQSKIIQANNFAAKLLANIQDGSAPASSSLKKAEAYANDTNDGKSEKTHWLDEQSVLDKAKNTPRPAIDEDPPASSGNEQNQGGQSIAHPQKKAPAQNTMASLERAVYEVQPDLDMAAGIAKVREQLENSKLPLGELVMCAVQHIYQYNIIILSAASDEVRCKYAGLCGGQPSRLGAKYLIMYNVFHQYYEPVHAGQKFVFSHDDTPSDLTIADLMTRMEICCSSSSNLEMGAQHMQCMSWPTNTSAWAVQTSDRSLTIDGNTASDITELRRLMTLMADNMRQLTSFGIPWPTVVAALLKQTTNRWLATLQTLEQENPHLQQSKLKGTEQLLYGLKKHKHDVQREVRSLQHKSYSSTKIGEFLRTAIPVPDNSTSSNERDYVMDFLMMNI